jgi:hypothetical protein
MFGLAELAPAHLVGANSSLCEFLKTPLWQPLKTTKPLRKLRTSKRDNIGGIWKLRSGKRSEESMPVDEADDDLGSILRNSISAKNTSDKFWKKIPPKKYFDSFI